MIAFLRGELAHAGHDAIVLDVGGVGYQVYVSARHLAELPAVGATLRVFTHLVHREDAMLLFGFPSLEERELFLLLNSVSGIGAKTAMGVLSALSVPEIVAAVVGNNPKRLSSAPGVGKKTAERIVLELREKLAEWQPARVAGSAPSRGAALTESDELTAALLALGYGDEDVASALEHVHAAKDPEDALRQALTYLSGY